MSEINKRYKKMARVIALALWGNDSQPLVNRHVEINLIETVLAKLESDLPYDVDDIATSVKPSPGNEITERHREIAKMFATMWIAWERDDPRKAERGPKYPLITPHEWRLDKLAAKLAELDLPTQTSGYVWTEDDLKKPLPEGTITVGSHDAPVEEHELWCPQCFTPLESADDPCPCLPNAIEILKMPKKQRDEEMRKSAEAMKDVDVESFDDYREEGVAWTERTQELCDKMRPTTPSPEFEDAVTDALLEIGVASKPNCKVLVTAVQPLFECCGKQRVCQQCGKQADGVFKLTAEQLTSLSEGHLEAKKIRLQTENDKLQKQYDTMLHDDAYQIKLLQDDNETLKKQIEYQREIHQYHDAAFEKINNEAHAKIETLQKQYDTMLHDDAYQIKLLQDDNETLEQRVVVLEGFRKKVNHINDKIVAGIWHDKPYESVSIMIASVCKEAIDVETK